MSEAVDNKRLVIATHNPGKLKEFQLALSLSIREIVSATSLSLPEPEETGTTFAEKRPC